MPLATLLTDLRDLCLPPRCAACRAIEVVDGFLCPACEQALEDLAAAPRCRLCAMPLAQHDAPCPFCRGAGVPHYAQIVVLGRFEEPLKTLIHEMKYQHRWPIAEQLAIRLRRQPRVAELLAQATCLVPVPLHRSRQISHGYNQAEVAARTLAPRLVIRPARRVRATESQTHLNSHAMRVRNLKNAFHLTRPDKIHGRHVVVIDDVMTSGATLQSLARALAKAQPASLSAIVFAIADPRGRKFESI